jgi:ABC-type dipeptide/oligopeptide/nickel transport system ATPase component
MAALHAVGARVNPRFCGDLTALRSVLRDAARLGVVAVGMSLVIVNKGLDLSVGSTLGPIAVLLSIRIAPTHHDLGAWMAVAVCLGVGLAVGLINGVLVALLEAPAFIATLTMLRIGDRKIEDEAWAVLRKLKVDVNHVRQKVETLSGGRQQSVAIARTLSFDPKVVILDGPTANLPVPAAARLLETMAEPSAHGVAPVIISHRPKTSSRSAIA